MTKLLKPKQVAERLSISLRHVHYLISSGELPTITIGKRSTRIDEDALNEYIEARRRDDFQFLR